MLGRLGVIATALACAACAQLGVVGDGTTVSWGAASDGLLIDGTDLPDRGIGYEVPAIWRARGSQWGTDELVGLIERVGLRVDAELRGTRVGVADLSRAGGGPGPHHRSHQTGRDVDLLLFATDRSGRPVPPTEMRHFGEDGLTVDGGPVLRFDARRTWVVVKAVLTDPVVTVDHIFIFAPLRSRLLDHARASGEPDSLVAWAGEVLSQPSDSAPHDDHMHIRIRCANDQGCVDGSRPRIKKPPIDRAGPVARRAARHAIVGSPFLRGPRW